MKLPNKITIVGQEWQIKTDPELEGGKCKTCTKEITVGTKNPKDVREIFIHEVIEALLMVRQFRFDNDEEVIFVMKHKELRNFIEDLLQILKQLKGLIVS